jgi:hypothetical protein
MLYGKLKYTFEAACFLFFAIVFVFSFIKTEENVCFKLLSISGLIIVSFSIASIKDNINVSTQNKVQFILGLLFLSVLAYSFFLYFINKDTSKILLYFSIASVFIGVLRLVEFMFCIRPYIDYLSLQREQLV